MYEAYWQVEGFSDQPVMNCSDFFGIRYGYQTIEASSKIGYFFLDTSQTDLKANFPVPLFSIHLQQSSVSDDICTPSICDHIWGKQK